MALTGTTNTTASTALRYLNTNNMNASESLAKLSSGSRIVKASDDAASLAVGTKLKADVAGLKQAQVNAGQASSVLQIADGGYTRIGDILQRMKALSVQSSSGSLSNAERAFLNTEFTALRDQLSDIATGTKFNGQSLIDGSAGQAISNVGTGLTDAGVSVKIIGQTTGTGTFTLAFDGTDLFTLTDGNGDNHTIQVPVPTLEVFDTTLNFDTAGIQITLTNTDKDTAIAANNTFDVAGAAGLDFQVGLDAATDQITVDFSDVDATALGLAASTVDTAANAQTAGTAIDSAISLVNSARASVGALMSRFEYVSENLATQVENLDAARSTLMDVDMAAEMTNFSSQQVLMQASVAMLAQANQMPQQLLRLLQ